MKCFCNFVSACTYLLKCIYIKSNLVNTSLSKSLVNDLPSRVYTKQHKMCKINILHFQNFFRKSKSNIYNLIIPSKKHFTHKKNNI